MSGRRRTGASAVGATVGVAVLAITLNLVLDRLLGLPMLPRWGVVIVLVLLASCAVTRLRPERERPEQ